MLAHARTWMLLSIRTSSVPFVNIGRINACCHGTASRAYSSIWTLASWKQSIAVASSLSLVIANEKKQPRMVRGVSDEFRRGFHCPTLPAPAGSKILADKEKVKKVQETLDHYLCSNHVIVFSQPNCPSCEQAKKSLENAGCKDYKIIDITQEKDVPILLTLLARLTGKSPTVPKVFINGRFIGGGIQCLRLEESGELEKILKHS